jgi:hypothetical protein
VQRFLPGGRLATKSSEGLMFIWQLESCAGSPARLEQAAAWRVPGCSSSNSWQQRCQFGQTADGRYIAAVRFHISALVALADLQAVCLTIVRACLQNVSTAYLCLQGNSKGDCFVFDSETGECVTRVDAVRLAGMLSHGPGDGWL